MIMIVKDEVVIPASVFSVGLFCDLDQYGIEAKYARMSRNTENRLRGL